MSPTNGTVTILPGNLSAMVECNDGYRPSFGFISHCEVVLQNVTWNPEPKLLDCILVMGKFNLPAAHISSTSIEWKSSQKSFTITVLIRASHICIDTRLLLYDLGESGSIGPTTGRDNASPKN